ncbi:4-hydroxyphenylacetate 3-monooxygenase, oxygenase component [Bacillus sp. FJAT-45350]|uniref:4-hydroxyphenylacetate 3-monooxygenase, oxygenase component n=1 Tax=Bacillus sp. FJAT-45350 TaxID=2011014 RepID=UPI000BB94947|nr:4-hydroxyphenylacetate 3-monooxygenase, oxygenase component [Bacillus sp. FJAT-45350]
MGARTGKEYLAALDAAQNNVWIHGEKVEKVSEHPAFKGIVQSMVEYYDLQHERADKMLYTSPTSGEKVGLSYIAPKTIEDLVKRREMITEWARYSGGMMGRSPDYLNTSIMAFGTAFEYFGQGDSRFAENARNYYEYCRENDISLTHTLIHPQANRSKIQSEQNDPFLSARVVEETDEGIIIKGCRLLATLGGVTDEIVIFPSTLNVVDEKDKPYAFAAAIPNNTPGLKFMCRESFDYGKNVWDHPMGARYDESDAIVVFDNVLIPWDRVFIYQNAKLCQGTYPGTHAVHHMAHQVVAKNTAKTEFLLGIILRIIDAVGIEKFPHVKEKASEVMIALETMRSHLFRAEQNATLDQYGNMTPEFAPLNAARNWYPKMYQRIVEILKILGASGLMAIPTLADFENPETGEDMVRYNQGANIDGLERVQLYRLAWDVCISAFGNRQALYEYYFFGDPARMSNVYYDMFEKDQYVDLVNSFLSRADHLSKSVVKA